MTITDSGSAAAAATGSDPSGRATATQATADDGRRRTRFGGR